MSPCPLVSLSPFLYLFLMQLTSVFLNKLTLYISCSVALRKRLPPSLRSSMLTPRSALVTLDSFKNLHCLPSPSGRVTSEEDQRSIGGALVASSFLSPPYCDIVTL